MNPRDFFAKPKLIGMVHLLALPGTPAYGGDVRAIAAQAIAEASLYQELGLDAIILENMHDIPYLNREVGPEIVSSFAAIATLVRQAISLPIGIQILAGANQAALAVAQAAELDFIRAEGFVFGHLADEGYMDSDAGSLLRYRRAIGAENIAVFTDIKKKHSSHAISADVSIGETASAAEFFRADGLIVTGSSTGKEASIGDLEAVRVASSLPLLIGSGLTPQNLHAYLPYADGFIVGSYFKRDGLWSNAIDPDRVKAFVQAFHA